MSEETVIDKMWERMGFTVTCKDCGSNQIVINNSLGYSALSGQWGSIDLICNKCKNEGEIYS